MDSLLKLTADAGHEVTIAEEAISEERFEAARDALDRAGDRLTELRAAWPQMTEQQRTVIGRSAQVIRGRLDTAVAALPARRALSDTAPVHDPDEDAEPEA